MLRSFTVRRVAEAIFMLIVIGESRGRAEGEEFLFTFPRPIALGRTAFVFGLLILLLTPL